VSVQVNGIRSSTSEVHTYASAARALHIHRSTLRYRLRRIRELSGHDLGAVDSRLNLHVATRAWQILRGVP